jgi:hypothetical protein
MDGRPSFVKSVQMVELLPIETDGPNIGMVTDNESHHYPILGAHILASSYSHVHVFLCFLYLRTYYRHLQRSILQ